MSDVAIERRDSAGISARAEDSLVVGANLFGTPEPLEIVQRSAKIADILMRVVEDRELGYRFAGRDWYGLLTWQLLATFLGVSSELEWCRPIAAGAGWEARCVVRGPDGRIIGAAEGMVDRSERNWRQSPEHSVRAMAQVRAQRRALVSVLGFIPQFAGYDVADPTAPATRQQVVALHARAGELGWDRTESHARAGVESFNDLTREQAGELLEAWSTLHTTDLPEGTATDVPLGHGGEPPEGNLAPPAASIEDAWAAAIGRHGSKVGVLKAALERWPDQGGVSAARLTIEELQELSR